MLILRGTLLSPRGSSPKESPDGLWEESLTGGAVIAAHGG